MTAEARFWEKVEKTATCWLWTGGRVSESGHGRFAIETTRATVRLILPHRFAWELAYGPVPAGLLVLHACDQPLCVRPSHLMVGSQQANMIDATRKGRNRSSAA